MFMIQMNYLDATIKGLEEYVETSKINVFGLNVRS